MWGIGTRFKIKGSDDNDYVDIAGIKNISPPGITTDMADATVLYSEDNKKGFEEKSPTLHRLGESTLLLLFEPGDTEQRAFLQRQINREKLDCMVLFPDGENFYGFPAYISGFELGDINPEGLLEATVTLSASGEPKFEQVEPGDGGQG